MSGATTERPSAPDAPARASPWPSARPLRDLAAGLLRHGLLALGRRDRVRDLVLRQPAARRLAGRFVAGERRDEALAAVAALNRQGIQATVDFLGENVRARAQAERQADEYAALLAEIGRRGLRSHVSLKLTAMGLDLDEALCLDLVGRVADRAAAVGSFVRIDMEGSAYTARTLRLFRRLRSSHPNLGVVLQAYLYRTAADVEEMIRRGAPVRLCKGAYDEPAAIAYPTRAEVDASYRRLMERLLLEGRHPALATHDRRLIGHAIRFTGQHRIGPERFEFQMLYGISRPLQARLVANGYAMRAYVPYGSEWYGYFMRRLAERPANLLFFLRSALSR